MNYRLPSVLELSCRIRRAVNRYWRMVMAHFHEDSDTYYLDQLCLIALSATFGGVCLTLYFWKTDMLNLMLGTQFHDFVGVSGFVLMGFAILRSVILWRMVGEIKQSPAAHTHDHEHGHDHTQGHDHTHDHAGHENGEGCNHDHAHDHAHSHEHDHHHGLAHTHGPEHDHGPEDHDHSWAPWRYVVLLIPVFLFILGLPRDPPEVGAQSTDIKPGEAAMNYAALIALAPDPYSVRVMVEVMLTAGPTGPVMSLEFPALESAPTTMPEWKGQWARVKGRYGKSNNNDHVFFLVRHRIQCCGADAIRLNVPIVTTDSLSKLKIKDGDWVEVTGRIDFQTVGGAVRSVLRVPNLNLIRPTEADKNPWVQ